MPTVPSTALLFAVSALLGLASSARAGGPVAGATSVSQPPPPIRQISPDVFEIHGVRLDKKDRTVTLPAVVNMTDGPVEYAIVGSKGKTHESVLRTDIQPFHLHLAMLLLGSKTASEKKPGLVEGVPAQKPPEIIDSEYLGNAPKLAGDDILIEIAFEKAGKSLREPLEELIWDASGARAMSRGVWLYNGSLFYEGKFCAQEDHSIASVITDPCALINNPREGAGSAAVWVVRPQHLPPEGTPVTVTLKLPATPEKTPTPNPKTK